MICPAEKSVGDCDDIHLFTPSTSIAESRRTFDDSWELCKSDGGILPPNKPCLVAELKSKPEFGEVFTSDCSDSTQCKVLPSFRSVSKSTTLQIMCARPVVGEC